MIVPTGVANVDDKPSGPVTASATAAGDDTKSLTLKITQLQTGKAFYYQSFEIDP